MTTQFSIIQLQESHDRKMKLPNLIFSAAIFFFVSRQFFLLFLSFCQQRCALCCQLDSNRQLLVRKFSGDGGCCGAPLQESNMITHEIHAKPFFFTCFFLNHDNYHTCWFVHAISGLKSPSSRKKKNFQHFSSQLGTRTCWKPNIFGKCHF